MGGARQKTNQMQKAEDIMGLRTSILAASLLFWGCGTSLTMRQSIMRDQVTSLNSLTSEEATLFEANWKIGEEIVEQDRMAWIGTDSVLPKLNQSEMQSLRGYVALGNTHSGNVYFYSIMPDSSVSIVASANFSNGNFGTTIEASGLPDSSVIKSALCLQRAKAINMKYIRYQNVHYNSYSFYTDTTITIYLAPGSVDNYYILCGGVRTIFDKNLNVVSNIELHRSIVVYKASQIGDVMLRSSSITPILNEIDIAQFLIWKNRIYNQLIATNKYGFYLYYVPDEDRIIKRAIPNDELKTKE